MTEHYNKSDQASVINCWPHCSHSLIQYRCALYVSAMEAIVCGGGWDQHARLLSAPKRLIPL